MDPTEKTEKRVYLIVSFSECKSSDGQTWLEAEAKCGTVISVFCHSGIYEVLVSPPAGSTEVERYYTGTDGSPAHETYRIYHDAFHSLVRRETHTDLLREALN